MQTTINFTVHQHESNPISQAILDNNRVHFSNQCKRLFEALMNGRALTSAISVTEFQIVDFRARIGDLKRNGVQMTEQLGENTRSKIWTMTQDQRTYNKKFL